MKRHLLMITTAASILVCGSVVASAQDDTDTPDIQQFEQAQQDRTDQGEPGAGGRAAVLACRTLGFAHGNMARPKRT